MHDRAATPIGAVKSEAAIAIEITTLLNIAFRITQVRPHVEKRVRRPSGCDMSIGKLSFLAFVSFASLKHLQGERL